MTERNPENRDIHAKTVGARRLMNTRLYKSVMGGPSEMKIWRDEKRGVGPMPIRINGRRYWFELEVYAYLDKLAAARRKAPGTASDDAVEDDESSQSDEKLLAKRLVDP